MSGMLMSGYLIVYVSFLRSLVSSAFEGSLIHEFHCNKGKPCLDDDDDSSSECVNNLCKCTTFSQLLCQSNENSHCSSLINPCKNIGLKECKLYEFSDYACSCLNGYEGKFCENTASSTTKHVIVISFVVICLVFLGVMWIYVCFSCLKHGRTKTTRRPPNRRTYRDRNAIATTSQNVEFQLLPSDPSEVGDHPAPELFSIDNLPPTYESVVQQRTSTT